MGPMQKILLTKAFEMTMKYLADSDAVKEYRQKFKAYIYELVDDTENPWDNETAKILLRFLGYTDDELR